MVFVTNTTPKDDISVQKWTCGGCLVCLYLFGCWWICGGCSLLVYILFGCWRSRWLESHISRFYPAKFSCLCLGSFFKLTIKVVPLVVAYIVAHHCLIFNLTWWPPLFSNTTCLMRHGGHLYPAIPSLMRPLLYFPL
jgi:hypothetical protein